MAKAVILLEDNENGSVKISSTPSAMEISQMVKSGHKTSPALDYCLILQTSAMKLSHKLERKKRVSSSGLILPD